MEDKAESYKTTCLDEGVLISLEEGEISFEEYMEIIDHCIECESCAHIFDEREREIRSKRPKATPIFALNAPLRSGCLTINEMVHFKSDSNQTLRIYREYVVTHSCSCPRCYEISYQLNDFDLDPEDEEPLFVCIPLRAITNDVMLRQIVGVDNYKAICKDLENEALAEENKIIKIVDFCDYVFQSGIISSKAVLLDYSRSDASMQQFRVNLVEYWEGTTHGEI